MRRAGVGARRHGRHVARLQNEEARRGRAPAAGRHISHHRNGRGDDLLDGLAHGIHQAAGRVQADDDQRGVFLLGLLDGARNDLGRDGVHHAIHVHRDHLRRRGQRLRGERQRKRENRNLVSQSTLTIHPSRTPWSEKAPW